METPSSVPPAGEFRFSIPSDFAYCRGVQDQVMNEVDRLGYCESARFAIALGFEEALVNAIRHGNKFDMSKRVLIEAQVTAKWTRISIEDEGPGFERKAIPDCRADENLEKASGRGILLIETYMTNVEYSKGGRRVTLYRENREDGGGCGP